MQTPGIQGLSLIGDRTAQEDKEHFSAVSPLTNKELQPRFYSASIDDVEQAAILAEATFPKFANTASWERAAFLRAIAENLAKNMDAIVDRAYAETGLPAPRLQGELSRTTGQLKLFADVLDEGSWLDARIDLSEPERKPLPRADIRSMLKPLGPGRGVRG